jgi:hypothetical protein
MYAGNDDLSTHHRDILTSMFRHVETLDLLTVFDDTTIDLRQPLGLQISRRTAISWPASLAKHVYRTRQLVAERGGQSHT